MQNELYNLRVKLATAQRELAQALYENDAAKRVIARLLAEKEVQPVSSNEPQEQKGSSNLAAYFKAEASRLIKLRKKEEKACEQSSLEAFRTMNMLTVSRKGPILNRESKFTVMDNYLRNVILVGASNGLVLGIDILSGMPKEYASFDAPVVALSANMEYTRFIGADRNGIVVLASLEDNVSPFTHDCGKSVVATMIHPKEEHAVVCYEDGEIEIFNSISSKLNLEIKLVTDHLNENSVNASKGFDAVIFTGSGNVNRNVIECMHDFNIKFAATKSAGTDNIDLKSAK